jgi:hypothetical protein
MDLTAESAVGAGYASRGAQGHNSSRGVRISSVTPAPLRVSK